jgi:hypothetical protein
MKTNYNYFLRRRNLTTKAIIESNGIKNYQELLVLLNRLRVEPPPKEDVEIYFVKDENKKDETKVVKKVRARRSSTKKKTGSQKAKASRAVHKKDTPE